jgi:hypothetical protein
VKKCLVLLALSAAMPAAGFSQGADVLGWKAKFRFHARSTVSPVAILGFAATAAVLQAKDSPREWGQGGAAYGERFGSLVGWSAIHTSLAFGLDSALHQDPRYYRSMDTGFWRRSAHALRGTILTRTDAGSETISTWRIGSAYGSAFLADMWYPGRLDTLHDGLIQGSLTLGLGLASNLGSEFWPDIKRKFSHRK